MIHLDTSFLVLALVRGSAYDRFLRAWLRDGEELAISSIGWAEFLCGPVDATVIALAKRVVGDPVPFGPTEAAGAALLFNETGRRRGSLADCMIAATAMQASAALATANRRDFARFGAAGLELAAT